MKIGGRHLGYFVFTTNFCMTYNLNKVPEGVSRWTGNWFHGGYGRLKETGAGCFGCHQIVPAEAFQKLTGFVKMECLHCGPSEDRYFKLDW
jgi:hypothetical protein